MPVEIKPERREVRCPMCGTLLTYDATDLKMHTDSEGCKTFFIVCAVVACRNAVYIPRGGYK